MPLKVIIITDTDLEREYQRGLERLRERWRMEHPQQRWRGGGVSAEQHDSTDAEKSKTSESRRVG